MKKLIYLLPFILIACTSNEFLSKSYRVLTTSKVVYDNIMKTSSIMYSEGKINEQQKDIILKYGNAFYVAHKEATSALIEYAYMKEKGKDMKPQEMLVFIKMKYLVTTLGDLVDKINIVKPDSSISKIYNAVLIAFELLEAVYGQTNYNNDSGISVAFWNASVDR